MAATSAGLFAWAITAEQALSTLLVCSLFGNKYVTHQKIPSGTDLKVWAPDPWPSRSATAPIEHRVPQTRELVLLTY